MEFSEILNYILGGGLLAAVVGIVTLKATLRKANADAEKAIAEADVEPLRKELHETREELRETKKEFGATKREMARLRMAIADANSCKQSDDCPVLYRLRDLTKGELPGCIEHGPGIRGQPTIRSKEDRDGDGTTITGETGDTDRQPP